VFHRRGRAACANRLILPARAFEDAVVNVLADALLHPRVLGEAVRHAAARVASRTEGDPKAEAALRGRVAALDAVQLAA